MASSGGGDGGGAPPDGVPSWVRDAAGATRATRTTPRSGADGGWMLEYACTSASFSLPQALVEPRRGASVTVVVPVAPLTDKLSLKSEQWRALLATRMEWGVAWSVRATAVRRAGAGAGAGAGGGLPAGVDKMLCVEATHASLETALLAALHTAQSVLDRLMPLRDARQGVLCCSAHTPNAASILGARAASASGEPPSGEPEPKRARR
jgi:hypothetical protein